ncbi:uncharacterized protein [Cicer arietinum]|uniref:Uncharacterized protein LOC105851643 n=1 Tax=Cicer arietinum TaxID=3827 RepID=A0A1S3DZA8_CICAR|nr:uncharacterized protein LOC105851643 [Cicer arietinum]
MKHSNSSPSGFHPIYIHISCSFSSSSFSLSSENSHHPSKMSLSTTASPTTASLTTASPNTTAADPIFHHVTFQHPDLNHHKPKWLVPVILTATAVVAMLMAVLIYWALKRRAEPAEKPTEEVQLGGGSSDSGSSGGGRSSGVGSGFLFFVRGWGWFDGTFYGGQIIPLSQKSEITNLNRLWHPWERETVEYFTLGDLWNCNDEWSAYGAGVPITLTSELIFHSGFF